MRNIWGSFTGKKAGRAFLLPAVIILLTLTIFPFLFSLFLSFGKVSFVGGLKIHFAGLKNWGRLFADERFYNALSNTILIAVSAVAIEYVLGLGLALLLNRKVKGSTFFRVLFLLPMMLTPIAVGYMWRMMFNPTRGPIDHILPLLGLPAVAWLTEPKIVLYSVILSDIWHWTPLMILILFAGLQSIPPALLEAAKVDGASGWQLFREVIFPLLAPASIAAILLRAVEVLKIVDKIYILTGGGPGISSESMTLFGYSLGLRAFDLAYGATIAFSLFITVLIISIVFLLMTRRLQEISLE
ncbi:MAG: carbohydrate ABC transporter permease [bacterium]